MCIRDRHRDPFKAREGKRRTEREQRSEQQVSEDRWGDRKWRTYIGMSRKRERERGREKKSKSTDLSNGSLKTDWEVESRKPTLISRKGGGEEKRKSRDLSNRSLKTDGETVSGELT